MAPLSMRASPYTVTCSCPPASAQRSSRSRLTRASMLLNFFAVLLFASHKTQAAPTSDHQSPESSSESAYGPLAKYTTTSSTTFFPSFIAPSAGRIAVLTTNETYASRLAAFGPRLDDPGIVGWLVPVGLYSEGNERGCQAFDINADWESLLPSDNSSSTTSTSSSIHKRNFTRPPKLISSAEERVAHENNVKYLDLPTGEPWIALVVRGECSFVEKVIEMELSGASAVIVGNNDNSGLITMYPSGDGRAVSIPSAFVAQGEYLQLKFQSWPPLLVSLSRDPSPPWPILDVVIVTIVAPALLMGLLFTLWRYRAQSRRRRASLAPPAAVLRLPTHNFCLAKRRPNDPETCAVCLEDFTDGEELRILPCRHEFHSACIDPWLLTRRRTCPICKIDVIPSTERTPLLSFANRTIGGHGATGLNESIIIAEPPPERPGSTRAPSIAPASALTTPAVSGVAAVPGESHDTLASAESAPPPSYENQHDTTVQESSEQVEGVCEGTSMDSDSQPLLASKSRDDSI